MKTDYVYRNPRPRLSVTPNGGKQLGNCYSASYYTVISTYPLTDENFQALFESGAIGYGQAFYRKEVVIGHDEVACITEVDGAVTDLPAINPYSGKPYGPIKMPYYTYEVDTRCDSGD